MKKVLLALVAVALLASPAAAIILNSAHDFTATGPNSGTFTGSNTETCVFCHTPHNAAAASAPLWNHEETTNNPALYATTGTLDATMIAPSGISKLCLSCHDGTVSVDSYGTTDNGTLISAIAGTTANLGNTLADDHPVGFTYDAALVTADTTTGGTAGLNDPTAGAIPALLFGASSNQVECSSCHDVHNQGAGLDNLLTIDNAASALCLTCHIK